MNQYNYYALLRVSQTASFPVIKSAYRKLAKQYHPDLIKNPQPSDQEKFALIAEAYYVLSDINRRRHYDASRQQPYIEGSWRTRPHYSGYPYFQWDIVTPAFHTFFMGRKPERCNREKLKITLLNWKSFMVSIVGALIFFKFFLSIEGTVIDKKIEAGLFQNFSYKLIYKNTSSEEKKKTIKAELFDMLKKDDQIVKKAFSFNYKVNEKEIDPVSPARFLMQVTMIYASISGGLLFLEYGRK